MSAPIDKLRARVVVLTRDYYDATVVARWAVGDADRLRASANEFRPGNMVRGRLLMAAIVRLEEGEEALRLATSLARELAPLLDALNGADNATERDIEAILREERENEVDNDIDKERIH